MSDLRTMIREVLAEEIHSLKVSLASGGNSSVFYEQVHLNSDNELNAFVRRIMDFAVDPIKRNEIATGRHVFSLGGGGKDRGASPHQYIPPSVTPAPAPSVVPAQAIQSPPTPVASAVRQEFRSGLMTERDIESLPQGTRVITIGKSVRLTPLAHDEVRRLNIKIERASA